MKWKKIKILCKSIIFITCTIFLTVTAASASKLDEIRSAIDKKAQDGLPAKRLFPN